MTNSAVMPLETVPDWAERLARQDAFWERGRPVVDIRVPRPEPVRPWPVSRHRTLQARWFDARYQAALAAATVANTEYLGDALPHAMPNLGPDALASFLGCPLEFGEDTSWSSPILKEWEEAPIVGFDEENLYWRKLLELTDAYLEAGAGRFYTGLTDFHPGGDLLAALRGPQTLALDMAEHRDEVRALLPWLNELYFRLFDACYERLRSAGQACCTWLGIVSSRRWYVPSNDFSCMISTPMFEKFFLPGIVEECRRLEASIYHLDGPGALRHLDAILAVEELDAVQWVYGDGHGRATDWIPVYRRIQEAGKGIWVHLEPDEVATFMEAIRPEGVWMSVGPVATRPEGEELLRRIRQW